MLRRMKAYVAEKLVKYTGDAMYRTVAKCTPRPSLRFEINLTEHCDLNCAGCTHFSPLAEPEFADFEEVSRDFARLSELLNGRAENIHLMGGEPLLYPNLIKCMEMARKKFPTANIELDTNGVRLTLQPEEFWLACRENQIKIRITKYPIKTDYDKIEEIAHNYQVKLETYISGGDSIKTLFKWGLDLDGKQDATYSFMKCHMANSCIQLSHGRLYTCNIAANIHHFNQYFGMNLDVWPEDSIDIYKAATKEEILAFLARPIPFCRYCKGIVEDKVPWHHSNRDISEWV